jgi:CHAT domain-containing protein/Tfp pilus assembly protein PilF
LTTAVVGLFVSAPSPQHTGVLQAMAPLTARVEQKSPASDVRPLVPGPSVDRELAGDGSHTYELALAMGQYVHVVVNQQGLDVAVTITGPDGKLIAEIDGPSGMYGPERLAVVADTTGSYRLVVSPFRATGPVGRYQIEIEELREATAADRLRVSAQDRLIEGQALWANRTADTLTKSLPKFEESLSLWRTVGDRRGEAEVLWYLADVQNLLQEPATALEILEKLLELQRSLADVRGEAVTLEHIASNYRFLGEYQKALEHQTEALRLARLNKDEELGSFLSEMGWIYFRLGEQQRALEYFEESLPVHRANGLRELEVVALWDIGSVHFSLGNLQQALTSYSQALPMATTLKMTRHQASILSSLGAIYQAQGDVPRAVEYFQQAVELGRKVGHRSVEATALSRLGEAYVSLADSEKALQVFEQALTLQRAMQDREFEALTLAGMARAENARGDLMLARQYLETSLQIFESLRSNVAQEALRATYLGSKEDEFKFHIDLLMRSDRGRPSGSDNAAALEASERWRARSLLEILTESKSDIRQGVDGALLQRERLLLDQLNTRAERQVQLLSVKRTEQAEVVGRQLDALLTEYRQVQAEIRVKSPGYAALTQPRPLSVPEIQREVLDRDSLLLEYSLGAERSYLWAVTPDSLTSHVLPKREAIEASARRFYELLTARNQNPVGETQAQRTGRLDRADAEYQQVAADLSQMLLGPLAARVGTKRLIIVSDGALQYVPFGALPAPATDPSKRVSHPLIVDHEVITLPSASVLHVLRRELTGRSPAPKTVAVLADPVFSHEDPRLRRNQPRAKKEIDASAATLFTSGSVSDIQRSAKESGVTVFERLRFSRQEADVVAALSPADERLTATDFAANRATAISPELGRYRIVHFATHGLLNNAHPELSGIVLSLVDEDGRPQDGFLRLHDIYNLRLGADLVVLSACRTALGREIRGEGLVGLTRGFMYAGVPRVLASLWNVDDRATAELMKQLYLGVLKEGKSPAAALRAAQVSMWKTRRWQAPYYWAAFVMQGEWR